MPHSTQYRSFRRRSSQPITWLIMTNKTVQENTDKQTQYKSQKVNNLKYSKTKLPWFSCLLQHSARKRGGLILQHSRAHMGINSKSHTCHTGKQTEYHKMQQWMIEHSKTANLNEAWLENTSTVSCMRRWWCFNWENHVTQTSPDNQRLIGTQLPTTSQPHHASQPKQIYSCKL